MDEYSSLTLLMAYLIIPYCTVSGECRYLWMGHRIQIEVTERIKFTWTKYIVYVNTSSSGYSSATEYLSITHRVQSLILFLKLKKTTTYLTKGIMSYDVCQQMGPLDKWVSQQQYDRL